jgi:RES domain-containing protein
MPPHVALPRDLWCYDVAPLEVADLSNASRLARVGLAIPQPGRRSWPPYQAVGEQLWREGWRGLVAPSAARPKSRVLVVYLKRGAVPAEVAPAASKRVTEAPVPPTGMQT